MKRILSLILALMLSVSLLSCSGKESDTTDDAAVESEETVSVTEAEDEKHITSEISDEPSAEETQVETEEEIEEKEEEKYPLEDKSRTVSNLTYNSETRSKLDVYLPAASDCESGKAPLVLYIHGGTWIEGSKSDIISAVKKYFTSNGYVFSSINYKFTNENRSCADMLAEIDSALTFLYENAEDLHIDTSKKIGVTGHSAGAHLSLMYGYTYYDKCAFTIGAIGAFAPLASFEYEDEDELNRYIKANPDILTICSWLLGDEIEIDGKDITVLDPVSPITYLSSDVPKTVMVYSTHDATVPPSTSLAFIDKLPESGAVYSVFALPNSGHNLDNSKDSDLLYEAVEKFAEFINAE